VNKTLAALFALLVFSPAFATDDYEIPPVTYMQGCTPGYWKNHPESWPFVDASTSMFLDIPKGYPDSMRYVDTLGDALEYHGGKGNDGAARILLRAAAAAWLNSKHPAVNYPLTRSQIRPMVYNALNSFDREEIVSTAAVLDAFNNWGCPLN
jgi:hypothetical protein